MFVDTWNWPNLCLYVPIDRFRRRNRIVETRWCKVAMSESGIVRGDRLDLSFVFRWCCSVRFCMLGCTYYFRRSIISMVIAPGSLPIVGCSVCWRRCWFSGWTADRMNGRKWWHEQRHGRGCCHGRAARRTNRLRVGNSDPSDPNTTKQPLATVTSWHAWICPILQVENMTAESRVEQPYYIQMASWCSVLGSRCIQCEKWLETSQPHWHFRSFLLHIWRSTTLYHTIQWMSMNLGKHE